MFYNVWFCINLLNIDILFKKQAHLLTKNINLAIKVSQNVLNFGNFYIFLKKHIFNNISFILENQQTSSYDKPSCNSDQVLTHFTLVPILFYRKHMHVVPW